MQTVTTHDGPSAHAGLGHVMPVKVLLIVWAALVVLTVATVGVTYVDMGRFNLVVALGVAAVKASLVGLYFMHLRYDSPFNGFVLVVALAFVALFIMGTIGDTGAYQHEMQPPTGVTISTQ